MSGIPEPLSPKLQETPQQVLGPYFLPDAPFRTRLYPVGARGHKMTISGQVLSVLRQPLAGATVDFWLADPHGKYDNEDNKGNPRSLPPAKQIYRGRNTTDASGKYRFDCLRPGNYYDNGWKLWRPAHIHVKVQAAGFKTLVSQLYFADDAHNTHDIPGDDFFLPELALQLAPAVPVAGITQKGTFNLVLTK